MSGDNLEALCLDARLASLEARVEALETERPGRKKMPILVKIEGICGVEPAIDSATCPYASLYRRRKGCLGDGCAAASAAYYEEYKHRVQ